MEINIQSREELERFLASEVVDTSEALQLLGCSRQNLHEQVTKGNIKPIRIMPKDRLFLKADILSKINNKHKKGPST